VERFAGAEGFVGHVGGDDFVAILLPEVAEETAKAICEQFGNEVGSFYDRDDMERGFVEVKDRRGEPQKFPLVSISVGIATTATRRFVHPGEAVDVSTEMKRFAKQQAHSSYAVDRRKTESSA
jgi:GGDEF domain-containing protein